MIKKIFYVIAFLFTFMAMPCSAELIKAPCSMEGMACLLPPGKIKFRKTPSLDSEIVGESIVSFDPIKVRLLKRQGKWGIVEYEAMNARGGIEKTTGWILLNDAFRMWEKNSGVNYSTCFFTSNEKVCIDILLNAQSPLRGFLRTEILETGASHLYFLTGFDGGTLVEIKDQLWNGPIQYLLNGKNMVSIPHV